MQYKLRGSLLAKETFQENLEYLDEEFPKETTLKFIEKVEDVFYILKSEPCTFPIWKENYPYRKAVIVKKITLFYEVDNNYVNILLFWNTLQNPKTLDSILK